MGTARAQYLPPPNAAESPIIIEPQHIAVVSSFDADSIGNRSAYVDGTFAPFSGIYESGIRVRATGSASDYRYLLSDDPRILGTGRYLEGGLLAGYGVWLPRFSLTGLVGPTFGDIVNQGVTTDKWGAKAVIEMNARPTDWTMASGSVSYSTIANKLQAEAKAGLKIYGDVYFGPEAKFTWQQIFPWQISFFTPSIVTTTPVSPQTSIATMRLGAHVSALNIGPVLIGVSGGWAHDRQLGSGYYGSANLYLPF
jgi:hypothetical protein